jgi:hypothetical protein
MAEMMRERRACKRFVIPGAVVNYRKEGFLRSGKYSQELSPLYDISRGGLRFVSNESLAVDVTVTVHIIMPQGDEVLVLQGNVRWIDVNPGQSYKYQIGIQFAPYGTGKGENDPEVLKRIIALETEPLDEKGS